MLPQHSRSSLRGGSTTREVCGDRKLRVCVGGQWKICGDLMKGSMQEKKKTVDHTMEAKNSRARPLAVFYRHWKGTEDFECTSKGTKGEF